MFESRPPRNLSIENASEIFAGVCFGAWMLHRAARDHPDAMQQRRAGTTCSCRGGVAADEPVGLDAGLVAGTGRDLVFTTWSHPNASTSARQPGLLKLRPAFGSPPVSICSVGAYRAVPVEKQ